MEAFAQTASGYNVFETSSVEYYIYSSSDLMAADEQVLAQSIDNVTDVTAIKRDNEQVESSLSKEWINPIEDTRLNTTEAAGRDIVDILLEQWTLPVGV